MRVFRNEKTNLLSIQEIADMLNVSESMVKYYAKTRQWKPYGIKEDGRRVYYDPADIARSLTESIADTDSQFGSIMLFDDEIMKPIDPINHFNGTMNFSQMIHACRTDKYCITNYGRIINMTMLQIFDSDTKCTNGYIQTKMNGLLFRNHQVCAYFFCDNAKNKPNVHHINGIADDNRAENLVYCTSAEHATAHKFLSKATETQNDEDWKAYHDYIEELRADNKRAEHITVIGRKSQDGQTYYFLIKESDYNNSLNEIGEPDLEHLYRDNKIQIIQNEYQIKQIRKEHKRLLEREKADESND